MVAKLNMIYYKLYIITVTSPLIYYPFTGNKKGMTSKESLTLVLSIVAGMMEIIWDKIQSLFQFANS